MKTKGLIIIFIFVASNIKSQDIIVEDSIKFLENKILNYQNQINIHQSKIDSFKNLIATHKGKIHELRLSSIESGIWGSCFGSIDYYDIPKLIGNKKLGEIPPNTRFLILQQEDVYYKIIYGDEMVYVPKSVVTLEGENMEEILEKDWEKRRSEINKLEREKREKEIQDKYAKLYQERKEKFYAKYPKEIADKIIYKRIWLGMTSDMARDSWGLPEDINRTVGSWGVHEQWIYGDTYLYFENGILTSWQD